VKNSIGKELDIFLFMVNPIEFKTVFLHLSSIYKSSQLVKTIFERTEEKLL